MPDITMCPGTDSDLCKTCYRCDKNTNTDLYKSYFMKPPIKDGICEYRAEI